MTTHNDVRLDRFLERLEASGRRVTPQRAMVCEALLAHPGHPTPMEIRDSIWQHDPSVSQATVYNTIAVLENLRLIRKLDIADDEHTHYDTDVSPHVNAVCKGCGRINDVHTDSLEALLGLVASRIGYQLAREGVTVYGLCPDCQQAGADI